MLSHRAVSFVIPDHCRCEKDGDLLFCFFLRRIRVSPAQIEFVHYLENGTMATRGGGIAGNWHILKNDIRTLTVTIREGTTSRRLILLSVLHASAAALELETLRDRAKAKESAATEKKKRRVIKTRAPRGECRAGRALFLRALSFRRGALLFGGARSFSAMHHSAAPNHTGAARKIPRGAVFFILFYRMLCRSLQIRSNLVQTGGDRRRRVGDGKGGDLLARVSPLKTSSVEKPLRLPKRMSVYGLSPTIVTFAAGTPEGG